MKVNPSTWLREENGHFTSHERLNPRRPVELIAITNDFLGRDGPAIAVTVSTPHGILRKVVHHSGQLEDLVWAVHEAAEWLARVGERK